MEIQFELAFIIITVIDSHVNTSLCISAQPDRYDSFPNRNWLHNSSCRRHVANKTSANILQQQQLQTTSVTFRAGRFTNITCERNSADTCRWNECKLQSILKREWILTAANLTDVTVDSHRPWELFYHMWHWRRQQTMVWRMAASSLQCACTPCFSSTTPLRIVDCWVRPRRTLEVATYWHQICKHNWSEVAERAKIKLKAEQSYRIANVRNEATIKLERLAPIAPLPD